MLGEFFQRANEQRENFNKFFATGSRFDDAFSTRKKYFSSFNKENTQKISFVFRRDPFVKSDETFFIATRKKSEEK